MKDEMSRLLCAVAALACLPISKPASANSNADSLPPHASPPIAVPDEATSNYFRNWPDGRAALFKLSDKLILAIPPQFQQSWVQDDKVPRVPTAASQLKTIPLVGFHFFLPDFGGYTPKNYRTTFDPDRVDVIRLEAADPAQTAPSAPGNYPPNMIRRALGSFLRPNESQDMYGLKCYRWISGERVTCYGRRDKRTGEDIMFYAYVPPFASWVKNPLMQADYFSRSYGGTHIVWRTSAKNLSRWHDIDRQIWKFIASWSVATEGRIGENACARISLPTDGGSLISLCSHQIPDKG
jgi:hypothetical protein